jgi:N-acetylneuraminate lyase
VHHTLSLGVRGLYVCGTTGEGMLLSLDERMRVLETVIKEASPRADVIVNISHMEFAQMLRLSSHATEVGAHAVSVLPPIYNPVTDDEVVAYFRDILDSVSLPLTLYNIPQLTKRPLEAAVVSELAAHPRLVGIKHSSEDSQMLMRFKQLAGGRLIVWNGRDAYYLGSLAMGADGAIGGTFQILGDIFVEITRAFHAGHFQRAQLLQQEINTVHARLMKYAPPKSIKRCLKLMGVDVGDCRLPFQPLEPAVDDFFHKTLLMVDRVRNDFDLPRLKNGAPHALAPASG